MFTKELLRAIFGGPFVATQVLSLAFLFLGWSRNFLEPVPTHSFRYDFNAYDAWRQSMDAFVLFASLAATLPYADSYVRDREQGLARYILLRMKHRKYISGKFLINAIVGGTAVAMPMALFFGFTSLVYTRTLPPLSATPYSEAWMWAYGFLGEWFIPHPGWYIFARIGLGFLFGATYATLGMALSPFVHSRYIVLSFPFVFFWIFGFAANFLGVPAWWSAYILTPDAILGSTAVTIFIPIVIILGAAAISTILFVKKYSRRYFY